MRVIGDMGCFAEEVLAAIARASRSVDVECFIIRSDDLGRALAQALAAAARRGVCCRVIYDPLGCRFTPRSFFRDLARSGVTVRRYGWLGSALLGRPAARNHSRLVVLDQMVGYTGGHAWGEEWLPAARGGRGWRDMCCRVEGRVVADFSRLFEQHWSEAAGLARIADYASAPGADSVRLLGDAPVKQSVILGSYIAAVSRACRRVWIANAYFYPPPALLRGLVAAVQRGVDVRVIVPGRSDLPIIRRAARAQYPSWIAAGLGIWEYQDVMMHGKYALVDDDWCLVGTFNVNAVSTAFAIEVAVESRGLEAVRQVEAELSRDFARSQPVLRTAVRSRTFASRILDQLAHGLMALATWLLRPRPAADPGVERPARQSASTAD